MPASGKSTFGDWLRDAKRFLHLDLELRDCLKAADLPRFWPERIWDLDEAGLARFVDYLRGLDRDVVCTWAFHTDLIPLVRSLVAAGFEPWWFEGDRLAARAKYVARGRLIRHGVAGHGTPDPILFDQYVASLVARWGEIAPIFGDRVVRTLRPDGTYPAPERIYASMAPYAS